MLALVLAGTVGIDGIGGTDGTIGAGVGTMVGTIGAGTTGVGIIVVLVGLAGMAMAGTTVGITVGITVGTAMAGIDQAGTDHSMVRIIILMELTGAVEMVVLQSQVLKVGPEDLDLRVQAQLI